MTKPPPSAGIVVRNDPEVLPRSTQRYSSLAVQLPLIFAFDAGADRVAYPGVIVGKGNRHYADRFAEVDAAIGQTACRVPNNTVGETKTPTRPRTVPNQSIF